MTLPLLHPRSVWAVSAGERLAGLGTVHWEDEGGWSDGGWNVYRDERGLNHLPGTNGGTPTTLCGLDAGLMTSRWHDPMHAGMWCTECFKIAASTGEDKT